MLTTVPLQELLPKYKQVTQAYTSAVTALGMRLLRLLALALDLPAEHFDPMFSKPMLFLRPLHYAPRRSYPDQVRCRQSQQQRSSFTLCTTPPEDHIQIRCGVVNRSSSACYGSRLFSHFCFIVCLMQVLKCSRLNCEDHIQKGRCCRGSLGRGHTPTMAC